jgi:hypothetical protein
MIVKARQSELSTDELDHILVEQLNSTKRQLKVVKRLLRLMPTDPWLNRGITVIDKRIQFFESMIHNKELIAKKRKRKKDPDIMIRNPVYEWYKHTLYFTFFGYKMITDSVVNYMSYFKKGK